MPGFLSTLVSALTAAVLALIVVEIAHRILLRLARRSVVADELTRRAHRPTQLLAVLLSVLLAFRLSNADDDWRRPVSHAIWLVVIGAAAWLVAGLLFVVEDALLAHYRTDVEDNREARRAHTQIILLRRVTVVVVAIIAVATMLLTFRGARAAGASLLASAGILAAVAAFAAQSLLGNVFAGLQIAFSDALKLDDVVVVEDEWGRVEEITLTYVVLHIWDDRRLTLPTSYFMSKPFENWTRSDSALIGTVELDVDWSVPAEAMRSELRDILESTELWNGRTSVLQVTDAVGTLIRVRALVSADDAPTLWDLRCLVRERLVGWLRDNHASALPRLRTEQVTSAPPAVAEPPPDHDATVFSGSPDAEERGRAFSNDDPPA